MPSQQLFTSLPDQMSEMVMRGCEKREREGAEAEREQAASRRECKLLTSACRYA